MPPSTPRPAKCPDRGTPAPSSSRFWPTSWPINPSAKHYTPTYSSWLNQVELWFAKIERDVIARGIFTSVADLKRKLMHYIRRYNNAPKPVKWVYRNPARRITTDSRVTVH